MFLVLFQTVNGGDDGVCSGGKADGSGVVDGGDGDGDDGGGMDGGDDDDDTKVCLFNKMCLHIAVNYGRQQTT